MLAAACFATALVGAAEAAAATSGGGAQAYAPPRMTHGSYGELHVVVPLSSGDRMVQMMKLRNISDSLKAVDRWGGTLDVKVVLYARGVSLLAQPDEGVRSQLDALGARGVGFEVCNNSLIEQDIDFHTLYGVRDEDVIPSGFAEVAYLQARQHYVVDPMN